jgi:tRNA A-37 threonylcarbamoyl transferase component Bud32
LTEEIVHFCKHIAGSCPITAICACGDYTFGFPYSRTAVEVLLIVDGFQTRLMNYVKVFDHTNLVVLAVDKWIFERDVDRGFLGEAVAGRLIFPCFPIVNEHYLNAQEAILKKRLVIELLENLVANFPELSYELHIKPEYFLYETILRRARVFPPMVHNLQNYATSIAKENFTEQTMDGFSKSLKMLENEHKICFQNGFVTISKEFVEAARNVKVRFMYQFRTAQRTLFNSLLNVLPNTLTILSQNRALLLRLQKNNVENSVFRMLKNPLNYVYVPTSHRLVSLASRMDIEAFSKQVFSAEKNVKVDIEQIGGVLNDVYLIRTRGKGGEQKAVVKRFVDWSGFKWFPLMLWSVGTRSFAVLGRSRLEKEVAINQQLFSKGFNVPKILHVNHNDRLVFIEYIEGENLSQIVKRIASAKTGDVKSDLEVIYKAGEEIANVHASGITLGDTKPENLMLGKNGVIFLLDLEQASRKGDKTWDVAEFIYYAGHYIFPLSGPKSAELITNAFIDGYLKAGGDPKVVEKAANPKYTKVFSIFVLPNIILAISNVCRRKMKE